MRPPISHRHLEVFQAVMAAGSVTAAASALHTSQPTVSRELARLEHLLGFSLFDRLAGRLRATARGLVLYEEVRRSFIGLEQILARAEALARFDEGALSLACLPALAHVLLPGACRRFQAAHPGVSISILPLESPELEEALTAQGHDLGLIEHDRAPPGTTTRLLFSGAEVAVLPAQHALLARSCLTPQDFAGLPFISLAPGDPYRRQVDQLFREHGVERRMVLETQSAMAVCALVREGLGLAIVNPLTAYALAGTGLAWRPLSVAIPFRVGLVEPIHRPSTPLRARFADALAAEAEATLLSSPTGHPEP